MMFRKNSIVVVLLCLAGVVLVSGLASAQGLGGLAKSIRNIRPANPMPKVNPQPKAEPEAKPEAKAVEFDVKRFGFSVIKPNADLVEHFGLPKDGGLFVSRVKGNTPAAKSGLKDNDFLLELNGAPVPRDPAAFMRSLEQLKTDSAVDVILLRNGKRETIKGLRTG